MQFCHIASPIGRITLVGRNQQLHALHVGNMLSSPLPGREAPEAFADARQQLAEYFAGTRSVFTVALAASGTAFQHAAWAALQGIPYGQTRSYGQQATALGNPKASRAVGLANGKNPIGIIVPCHRVIGANGSLTGYAGGLEIKQWLLAHEAGQTPLPLR